MDVVLYSTHCPKCNVLETKLKQKNIQYQIVEDIDIMQTKNFMTLPQLEINGEIKDFKEAIDWINTFEE